MGFWNEVRHPFTTVSNAFDHVENEISTEVGKGEQIVKDKTTAVVTGAKSIVNKTENEAEELAHVGYEKAQTALIGAETGVQGLYAAGDNIVTQISGEVESGAVDISNAAKSGLTSIWGEGENLLGDVEDLGKLGIIIGGVAVAGAIYWIWSGGLLETTGKTADVFGKVTKALPARANLDVLV